MIGSFNCPACGTRQKFAGRCRECSKKRRADRAAELKKPSKRRQDLNRAKEAGTKNPPKPSGRLSRRTRVKAKSDKRILAEAALKAIKVILGPFVTNCLRCNCPGSGFKSSTNPGGFEAHHWARRRGYFFFVVIPLCPACHEEVERHGDQARADRWLIKDPIKK